MTASCIVILYNCGQLNFILDKKMKATSSDGPNYKGDLLGHLKCSGDILIYIIIKYSSIPIFLFNVYIYIYKCIQYKYIYIYKGNDIFAP